jgi:oligosaccharyltransferase complex subunit gamma
VITLADDTYANFATGKGRPYSLMVFLTATHPKFKCGICKQLDREFQLVAESYKNQIKASGENPSLFFVRLDYEASQKTFGKYQVSSVPMVFYISGQASQKEGDEYNILIRDRYQVSSDPDAESLSSFIRERSGVSIAIKRSMILTYISLLIFFGLIAAAVPFVVNLLPTIISFLQMKPLWALISAAIYTCAISGLIFDIIRTPQWYYANPQTGQIMFFYPQSGSQFVVEGFIIGGFNLMCSISLIFVTMVVPRFKSEQVKTFSLATGLLIFAFCFSQVRGLYRMKNRWYGSSM